MNDYIERREHDEFSKRMEDEHTRQSRRITILEETVRQIGALATSVEKLACNMEYMLTEQKRQGTRLETLESKDGEMWRKSVGYILSAIIGAVVCYFFAKLTS
jgi:hypothetical protein